jgi:hypothetical protein
MKLNILTGINSPTLYFPNLLMGMLYLTVESGFSMGIFEQNSGLNTGIPIFHWVYLCLFPGIRAKFEPVGWRLCRKPTGSIHILGGEKKDALFVLKVICLQASPAGGLSKRI